MSLGYIHNNIIHRMLFMLEHTKSNQNDSRLAVCRVWWEPNCSYMFVYMCTAQQDLFCSTYHKSRVLMTHEVGYHKFLVTCAPYNMIIICVPADN